MFFSPLFSGRGEIVVHFMGEVMKMIISLLFYLFIFKREYYAFIIL